MGAGSGLSVVAGLSVLVLGCDGAELSVGAGRCVSAGLCVGAGLSVLVLGCDCWCWAECPCVAKCSWTMHMVWPWCPISSLIGANVGFLFLFSGLA